MVRWHMLISLRIMFGKHPHHLKFKYLFKKRLLAKGILFKLKQSDWNWCAGLRWKSASQGDPTGAKRVLDVQILYPSKKVEDKLNYLSKFVYSLQSLFLDFLKTGSDR
jgi:hypothetical protein